MSNSHGFPKCRAQWATKAVGQWLESLDGRRIPLTSEERSYRPGPYPYYGASGPIDSVDGFLFDEPLVLVSEDGANLVLRSTPIAYLATGRYWVNNHAHVLRPRGGSPRYWAHRLDAEDIGELVTGSAQPKLTASKLLNLRVSAPESVEVQEAIADFLDRETAQIDTLIAEQERLIALLRERREAIFAERFASTDGKRSTTVRRVLRPLMRPAVPGLGVVTAYRDGVVTLRSNRRDDGYTFSDTEHGYQEIRVGDLVFHALDGFAGAIGISDSQGNATPVYHVCAPVAEDDPEYLATLLRYLGVSGFLATQAPNVRERSVDFRNWSTFARVPLELPNPAAQRRAVADIRQQTVKIDELIAETKRFIELARERRTALIAAAVTGQIDVREGAA